MASIGISGKVTRNGLLPWAGGVTRIAEGVSRCIAAPIEGDTPRGAEIGGAASTETRALDEGANLGLAGGGVFRAINPAELLGSGAGPGSIDGFDSIAGEVFEFVEGTFATDSKSRLFPLGFSSESTASTSLLARGELPVSRRLFPAGGVEVLREAASAGRSGCAGDGALSARMDLLASRSH